MPLIDTMAAILHMRRPGDLTRGELCSDAMRRLAKVLYIVWVSGAGTGRGRGGYTECG